MTVVPGFRLGPYEAIAPIGAGGMGEVWRGRDTRLDRNVAIKILPEGFAQNEQFRARFEREAKTISSLNHPHICTLFDVGFEKGAHFLVMELLEGESLADRITKGPMPPDQVLRFGAQIADALDRAHKQGIVHRDLKPGNVMITKGGAKLLDFGLARSSRETAPIRGLTEMPTQARPLTEEGTILGTFQYMAPEQLEGIEADARTDIFALGALLYEMSTGRRAFEGASRTSLIAAIVSSQPAPISSVAPMTPPALDHVVRKCLEKDRDDRWQSAHDVASELRWISEGGSQVGLSIPAGTRLRRRERVAWAVAALASLAALAATALHLRSEPPRVPIESSIELPQGMRLVAQSGLALSPDGQRAVFALNETQAATPSLWLRSLSSADFRALPGTQNASQPFWSPDSRKVAFFASGKLKAFDIESGSVTVVCDAPAGGGGSWGSKGTILFGDLTGPLKSVRASGGTPVAVTKLRTGETSHRRPFFLADGNTFLFMSLTGIAASGAASGAVSQSSLDEPEKITPVIPNVAGAAWVEQGIVIYAGDNQRLLAQRYDPAIPGVVGDRVTVSELFANFSAANDGKLLVQRNPNLVLSQLVWVSRSGAEESTIVEPGLYFSPTISRDQRRFAVDVSAMTTGNGDIWIYDVARRQATRVTYDEENESAPRWSADDRSIIYFGRKNGTTDIHEISTGGTGTPRLVTSDLREKRPTDVSRDGQWIVFNSFDGANMDIGVWSAAEKKARLWLATPFREQCAQLSSDGKWIAYQSDESGRWEIYVRAFPESDRKWLISSGGGVMPVWRRDGRELFYVTPEGKMMAAAITPGPELETGDPVMLFDAVLRQHPTTQYDVTADGQRFLLNRRVANEQFEPVALLQNWDVALAK